ncbi:MAG: hypothetical protein KDK04_06145 [Candidatus Competibacteraceae bacterium]|nr:hypothetical protein [Candidatus Competibacteraceae bacterium]
MTDSGLERWKAELRAKRQQQQRLTDELEQRKAELEHYYAENRPELVYRLAIQEAELKIDALQRLIRIYWNEIEPRRNPKREIIYY